MSQAPIPQKGQSWMIDDILARGVLRVAVIEEFPWLVGTKDRNGQPVFAGPAWTLASEYAKRLGVMAQTIPVDNEHKVSIVKDGGADLSLAPLAVTIERQKIVDFVEYSTSSLCLAGNRRNPKLTLAANVSDLDRPDIKLGYIVGTPVDTWARERFQYLQLIPIKKSDANAPVEAAMTQEVDLVAVHNDAWPRLNRTYSELVTFPKGRACLQSTEFATPMGLAVRKGDPVFLGWLNKIRDELAGRLEQERNALVLSDEE